jgi:hypothetical protein
MDLLLRLQTKKRRLLNFVKTIPDDFQFQDGSFRGRLRLNNLNLILKVAARPQGWPLVSLMVVNRDAWPASPPRTNLRIKNAVRC